MNNETDPTASTGEPAAPGGDAPRAWDDFDLGETPGFFRHHRLLVTLVLLGAGGGLAWFWKDLFPSHTSAPTRRDSLVVVNVPPPPPPPPVVTPPPPPPEQKMIEQTPVENETKSEPMPDEPPPADVATAIPGTGGPDAFGLGRTGGSGPGGNGKNGSAQRSRWGWYASQVQSRIQQAVQSHRATRSANLRADVKVWADASGRIIRAAIASSSGNAALDAALRDEVLTGLQLTESPPEGMPMPIVLRVTARRPN